VDQWGPEELEGIGKLQKTETSNGGEGGTTNTKIDRKDVPENGGGSPLEKVEKRHNP
jgi:hypothetical protein